MRTITILVVGSPSLTRVIQHLFSGQSEFEVVGALDGSKSLDQQAGRFLPELIVANVKPVSIRIGRAVASIKKASPLSKLILICPAEDLARVARECGADACLNDEKPAGRLLRMARVLLDRPMGKGAGGQRTPPNQIRLLLP